MIAQLRESPFESGNMWIQIIQIPWIQGAQNVRTRGGAPYYHVRKEEILRLVKVGFKMVGIMPVFWSIFVVLSIWKGLE
jgi:hypothetical protein